MKKLFTLLTLALISIGTAWGTEVDIVKFVGETGNTGITLGGSTAFGTVKINTNTNSVNSIQLKNGYAITDGVPNNYIKLTVGGGFKTGDVVTIAGCYSNSSTKGAKADLYTITGSSANVLYTSGQFINGRTEADTPTPATYTLLADADVLYISRNAVDNATTTHITVLKVTRNINAPLITTQPEDAEYLKDATATALSVEATASTGELSYQWYTATSTAREGGVAISGATSSKYTPSTTTAGTFYYYCFVKDGNGGIDSKVATITVSEASAPTSVTITPSATSVEKNEEVTLTATADGTPAPTFQWYSNTTEDNTSGTEITGATEETYSPSTATIGTTYYYVVATNASGSKTSATQAIEVKASSACQLISVKFSNGAYGAITEPVGETPGIINVPYLLGETEPEVVNSEVEVSEDASYEILSSLVIVSDVLIVTAEDGNTTASYDINKIAITPLTVTGNIETTTFTEVPSWVSNPYGFDAEKGVKFAKKVNEASNMRISKGNTRQYYFIGAAETLTLTSGTAEKRDINVYRNGVKLDAPTATAASGSTIDIALDESAPCMIMIESNQTGGDGGFTKYAVTAPTTTSVTISKYEWATFCSDYALDFTGSDVKAYIVTGEDGDAITKTEVTNPAAGTPLLLNASEGDHNITIAAEGDDYSTTNKLQRGAGLAVSKPAEGSAWVLGVEGEKAMFQYIDGTPATVSTDKAYLLLESTTPTEARSLFLDDDVTGIKNIKVGSEDNIYYDLQGRRVLYPTKGLYIVNGKKVILK